MARITKKGMAYLAKLWDDQKLPKQPDFSLWSLDWGREVASFIDGYVDSCKNVHGKVTGEDKKILIDVLQHAGVWGDVS